MKASYVTIGILSLGVGVSLHQTFKPKEVATAPQIEAAVIPSMPERPKPSEFHVGGSSLYRMVTVEHEGHRFVVTALSGTSAHVLHHPDCEKRDAQAGH